MQAFSTALRRVRTKLHSSSNSNRVKHNRSIYHVACMREIRGVYTVGGKRLTKRDAGVKWCSNNKSLREVETVRL